MAKLLRTARNYWFSILVFVPIFCCFSTLGYSFIYNHAGRITNFRPISGEFHFPDTNYTMTITKGIGKFGGEILEIHLQNTINHDELKIIRGTIGGSPEFSTFRSEDRNYFILKTASLGNDGGMRFQIYHLSEEKVIPFGANSAE